MSCVCSSNATMLPQHYTINGAITSLVLGPLFPGQNLTCSTGGTRHTLPGSLQESISCMASLVPNSLKHTHCLAQLDIRSARLPMTGMTN